MPHNHQMPESVSAAVRRVDPAGQSKTTSTYLDSQEPGLRVTAWAHRMVGTREAETSRGVRTLYAYEAIPCEVVMVGASNAE